jgi:amicyanin
MKNKKLLVLIIAIIAVVIGGGYLINRSASMNMPATSTSSTAEPVKPNAVTIKGYAFNPTPLTVKKGTTVTWTNQDIARHNIVADTPSTDAPNGPLFGKGETFSYTFTKAGTYKYHCEPHPYMKGEVIVTE